MMKARSRKKGDGDDGSLDPSSSSSSSSSYPDSPQASKLASPVLPISYIYLLCVCYRCFDALCVQTHFNPDTHLIPDEYWQSLEVAHKLVFGKIYGHLTWEWKEAIRGYLHPFLFAVFYQIIAVLHIDTPWLVIYGPRFFQAFLVALGDVYVYKLADKLFGSSAANWALVCQLFSWFNFYSLVRTYSNSLEAILTVIALYYWPYPSFNPQKDENNRAIGLLLGAISFVLRPTSAITWAYLGMYHIVTLPSVSAFAKFALKTAAPIGILVLGTSTVLDKWCYGYWVFVPYEFVKVNILAGVGDFYGTHSWHWYFTQGFTVMAFTLLPIGLFGIWKCGKEKRSLAHVMLWIVSIYSLLGHKEFRFIHSVLLLFHVYCGYALSHLFSLQLKLSRKWKAGLVALLLLNVPMATYFCFFHQRAPIDVMWYINTDAAVQATTPDSVRVDFLSGCHCTPFHAYVHNPNISMSFLDCTPNWRDPTFVDESKRFEQDPTGFAEARYQARKRIDDPTSEIPPLPTHVVIFSDKLALLQPVLAKLSFKECSRFSHVPVEHSSMVYSPQPKRR